MLRLMSLLLLLSLCGSFCSCAGFAEYREILVKEHSARDIYDEIVLWANNNKWRANPAETDVSERIYTSRWRGGGGPILGADGGPRVRLFAQVVRPRDTEGWLIQYYFERQRIGEVGRGMNPDEDDWERAGQDERREASFRYAMTSKLLGEGFNGVEPTRDPDR